MSYVYLITKMRFYLSHLQIATGGIMQPLALWDRRNPIGLPESSTDLYSTKLMTVGNRCV